MRIFSTESFDESVNRFLATCKRLEDWGANTEAVHQIFWNLMRFAFGGMNFVIPSTKEEWGLNSEPGADQVASSLHSDASDCVQIARDAGKVERRIESAK